MPALKIHPTPFRPSPLSIPPSPFSPRSPLHPQPHPTTRKPPPPPLFTTSSIPPPASPLPWLWQCHLCHTTYPLGTTRRCLDDGHYFCAGTSTKKVPTGQRDENGRLVCKEVVRRHKACKSEFDYDGWGQWARWRRAGAMGLGDSGRVVGGRRASEGQKPWAPTLGRPSLDPRWIAAAADQKIPGEGCAQNCDYPSECRWGRRMSSVGGEQGAFVHTPVVESALAAEVVPTESAPVTENAPATEEPTKTMSLLTLAEVAGKDSKGLLVGEGPERLVSRDESGGGGDVFWGGLMRAARKRRDIGESGLGVVEEVDESEGEEEERATSLKRDAEGDVVMRDVGVEERGNGFPLVLPAPEVGPKFSFDKVFGL
ncbi:hypothetical protein EJ06DRAFT_580506 [Trichodelitschia bisporula]|uniref:Uncharacterized protein n=1 Tax=Trichodelitschia bisporula TaxID=703511 RepID=A0A6G1I1Z2_9PEZI|nr:hypothetical protein EJ06DRAFT_580506 [Trichodelitschia bisporula]